MLLPLFCDMGNLFGLRAAAIGLRRSFVYFTAHSSFAVPPEAVTSQRLKPFTTEGTGSHRVTLGLSFHVFGEHFFGVDGDENAAAAGQDFVAFVEDFGGVDVFGSADLDFTAFYAQGFVQRDGLQIFDGHLPRERDYLMQLIYFAHGVVEDAGDDAAVAVARGAGVAVAEAEFADEGLAGFVEDEFQAHALGIVLAADEAVVLLHFDVAGVVALGL